jgi:hypothetical protein
MQEPASPSSRARRPAAVFRTLLAAAAAKERSSRARRPDRVQAIASLADSDLATLTQVFEQLLHASADVSAMASSLHATLRTLSPDAPSSGEGDDA